MRHTTVTIRMNVDPSVVVLAWWVRALNQAEANGLWQEYVEGLV